MFARFQLLSLHPALTNLRAMRDFEAATFLKFPVLNFQKSKSR
jgi:hypothetical protein